MARKPLIDDDGEVRELTADDLSQFRPAKEVLPPDLYGGLLSMNKRHRGKQKRPVKVPTTLRLSPEVLEGFKATGPGWQTRIDAALKAWLKDHRA